MSNQYPIRMTNIPRNVSTKASFMVSIRHSSDVVCNSVTDIEFLPEVKMTANIMMKSVINTKVIITGISTYQNQTRSKNSNY
jgi:hypothetical protein